MSFLYHLKNIVGGVKVRRPAADLSLFKLAVGGNEVAHKKRRADKRMSTRRMRYFFICLI